MLTKDVLIVKKNLYVRAYLAKSAAVLPFM